MRRRSFRLLSLFVAVLALGGCAGLARWTSLDAGAMGECKPMTQARLEQIFADQVDAIAGPPGAIQTQIDGLNVYLISDPENDRMRMVVPIQMVARVDPRVLGALLVANFNNSLDSRYAVSDGVIYSAFMHPISSLTPDLVRSALAQVVSLAKTFGSTFTAGELAFPPQQE
jgi:hypothetical protein